MRYILEGIDGSGKSTLAAHLSRTSGMEIHHSGGPTSSAEDVLERIGEQLHQQDRIFDRNICISELVYGKILRDEGPRVPPEALWGILKEDFIPDSIFIYCRPSYDLIREHILTKLRSESEGKTHKPPEHVEKVLVQFPDLYREYDEVMTRLKNCGGIVLHYVRN